MHPLNRPRVRHCLICGIAMVGDKSTPGRKEPDIFRCLNCHSVVDLSGQADKVDLSGQADKEDGVPL